MEPDELRLHIPLLALGPAGRLEELVVAVLQRGDPLRHFLGEFADLILVHVIVRWADSKTKAIYQALFI